MKSKNACVTIQSSDELLIYSDESENQIKLFFDRKIYFHFSFPPMIFGVNFHSVMTNDLEIYDTIKKISVECKKMHLFEQMQ